jgi:hypothetical protein
MTEQRFEFSGSDPSDDEQLSSQWLADLRVLPDFTPEDEALIARIQHNTRAVPMFAARQRLRQDRNEDNPEGEDYITIQLQVIRDVFGTPL